MPTTLMCATGIHSGETRELFDNGYDDDDDDDDDNHRDNGYKIRILSTTATTNRTPVLTS